MSMNLAAPIVVGTLLEPSLARASTVPLVAARRSAPQLLVDVEAALARARALPRTGPAYLVAAALSGALAIALPLAYLLAVAAFFAGGAVFAFVAVALASPMPSTLFAIAALGFASAGLVTAWPVLALLTRGKRREHGGIGLTESNEPLLVGLVEAVARAVQVPVPDRIELAPGADASIEFGGGRVTLRLGAALLTTLSVAELVAVVAHELGHARQGTARRITLFVHHTATWMLAAATALDVEDASWSDTVRRVLLFVVLLPLSLAARLADALVMALAREQERDADVVAAAIAGHPQVASSLARICAASVVIDDVIADAAHGGPCIDDLARFAAVRIEGLTAAQRKSMARRITRDGAGVVHPTYDDRVNDVVVVAKPAAALPQDAAANLVRDLRGLSKRATEAHWRSMIAMPGLVDTDAVLEQRARGAATVTRGLPRFLR